jgi:hypothetical protein
MSWLGRNRNVIVGSLVLWILTAAWVLFALWFYLLSPWAAVKWHVNLPPGTYCYGDCGNFGDYQNPPSGMRGAGPLLDGLFTIAVIGNAWWRQWKYWLLSLALALVFMGVYLGSFGQSV